MTRVSLALVTTLFTLLLTNSKETALTFLRISTPMEMTRFRLMLVSKILLNTQVLELSLSLSPFLALRQEQRQSFPKAKPSTKMISNLFDLLYS